LEGKEGREDGGGKRWGRHSILVSGGHKLSYATVHAPRNMDKIWLRNPVSDVVLTYLLQRDRRLS